MSYDLKELIRLVMELYQKTNNTVPSSSNKGGLEAILDAIKKTYSGELPDAPASAGKTKQKEGWQQNLPEDENLLFWRQEAGYTQGNHYQAGPAGAGKVSPVSIYETVRDINIQIILPGIVSRDDLHLLISRETLELYGVRDPSGGGKPADNFHKTIRLPAMVEPAKAAAAYRNGLLSISVPKKSPEPPLAVDVKFE